MSAEGQEGMRAFLEKRKPAWMPDDHPRALALIANRGEIAVRIIRACREAGIESVAVYSDADARAAARRAGRPRRPHRSAAPAESYLSIPALLEPRRARGATPCIPATASSPSAPAFARACAAAGLIFIGPPADAIERMGSKIGARALMEARRRAGRAGRHARRSDRRRRAGGGRRRIGFPVLVKASAGGGGKGMRIVRSDDEARELMPAARREAAAAFGDGTLYVERLIERPRHVEVQVFADAPRPRRASVRARVLAPAPPPEGHRGEPVAGADARAARRGWATPRSRRRAPSGYRNAGTIEFLLEGDGDAARFYFLEMNTRLQVEHPVTEAVTGVDLVRAQLAVAAGEPLPWTQARSRSAATRSSAASTPRIRRTASCRRPDRCCSIASRPARASASTPASWKADVVGVNYDPLLAKLIAHAETRDAAIRRLGAALRAYPVLGIRTNIPFPARG